MKVLIVAKTRQGSGACVGGITFEGHSVRLIAADAATNEHAGPQGGVQRGLQGRLIRTNHILPM